MVYNQHMSENICPDILIVEDDDAYREALCDMLALEGLSSKGIGSVQSYNALADKQCFKLILLDRNLPDGDGIDILKVHRQQSHAPVVFITCEGQLEDRVAGLEADADYYMVKPVQNDELLAIVHRCLRRNASPLQSKAWVIDLVKWTLQDSDNHQVSLTRTEQSILNCFVGAPGLAVSRADIVRQLGKDPISYDYRRLEVAIRRLRKKIAEGGLGALPLESVYGFGYVLNFDLKTISSG